MFENTYLYRIQWEKCYLYRIHTKTSAVFKMMQVSQPYHSGGGGGAELSYEEYTGVCHELG